MCFNMVVIPTIHTIHGRAVVDIAEMLELVEDKMSFNSHGYSAHVIAEDGGERVIRTLDKEEFKKALLGIGVARMMHLHFRLASSGSISLGNVHMWDVRVNDEIYRFSHNGFVSRFSSFHRYYGDVYVAAIDSVDSKSDSRQMAEDQGFAAAVSKALAGDIDSFYRYLESVYFYGVGFLTNARRAIGFSRNKQMQLYLYDGLFIMANEEIGFGYMMWSNMLFNVSVPSRSFSGYISINIEDGEPRVEAIKERPIGYGSFLVEVEKHDNKKARKAKIKKMAKRLKKSIELLDETADELLMRTYGEEK